MVIGERLRDLRESKRLSQGDIEHRSGLLRCYTSRVENGHAIPSIETLEKYARALEVPLYLLFYDGIEPAKKPNLPLKQELVWGSRGKEYRDLRRFTKAVSRMNDRERQLLIHVASKMASRSEK